MEEPRRLWRALESVPGLAAVEAEWKRLIGLEYDSAKAVCRPNGKTASSWPCPDGCGCAHEVIAHSQDDIVAVCRCEPKRCDTVVLKRTDLAVYELDWGALGTAITSALRFVREDRPVDGLPTTRRIGTYSPYAGFRFPVYLTIQFEPDGFRQAIEGLVAREDGPFILLAPTHGLCGPECERLLKKREACFLPLSDFLTLKNNGTFAMEKPIEDILAGFRAAVLPSPKDTAPMVFFPTPPDATWGDVCIKFKDGHTVSVKVKEAEGVFNYTQMGMVNRKNGNPTVQWELLRAFADKHGTLDWSSPSADRKNQKRREILAENLRNFFRIEGDPFRWTKDCKDWESLFTISYDE